MERALAYDTEQIRSHIQAQLDWDARIEAAGISVDVLETTAVLTGTVPTYKDKHYAGKAARLTPGVAAVDNQLLVRYPNSFTLPSDADIESNIRSILLWSTNFNTAGIKVASNSGVVTLQGNVDAYWEKTKVEDMVSDVIGVVDIHNRLTVVPTETFRDADISQLIMTAIERNMNLNPDTIDVEVANGIVTLNGAVTDWISYHTVENIALYTAGVRSVVSNLAIEYRR